MALSVTLNEGRNIRQYLEALNGKDKEVFLTINGELVKVNNIEIVWEGSEYYIIYHEVTGVEGSEDIGADAYIRNLDNCLPIKIS